MFLAIPHALDYGTYLVDDLDVATLNPESRNALVVVDEDVSRGSDKNILRQSRITITESRCLSASIEL